MKHTAGFEAVLYFDEKLKVEISWSG